MANQQIKQRNFQLQKFDCVTQNLIRIHNELILSTIEEKMTRQLGLYISDRCHKHQAIACSAICRSLVQQANGNC